jgi:hypothetical protein
MRRLTILALTALGCAARLPPEPTVVRTESSQAANRSGQPAPVTAPILVGGTWAPLATRTFLLDEVLEAGELNAVGYPREVGDWRLELTTPGWGHSCQADFSITPRENGGFDLRGVARVDHDADTVVEMNVRTSKRGFYHLQTEESPSGRCAFGVWVP